MNENLNLVEILKDCPKGTRLYSVIHGNVFFSKIDKGQICPIVVKWDGTTVVFTPDGKLFPEHRGECTLFPSKEQRDWSKFNTKKKEFVTPCKFKDGDIVATGNGSQVFILKRDDSNGKGYCYIGYSFNYDEPFPAGVWLFNRLATEEEKRKFFDAIKLNGYKWNAETKILERWVKPKFDPKTLQPFDKVLGFFNGVWNCDLYSHYYNDDRMFPYVCFRSCVNRIIPYNDDTKHLGGTTDEAPEYYRYWED